MSATPVLLSDCVAQVESAGNHYSMRYEAGYCQNNDVAEETIDLCAERATGGWIDPATAQMICDTSWGKFQIMGANLYGNRFEGTIFEFCESPTLQLNWFRIFIKIIGFEDVPFNSLTNDELTQFALHYNGSPIYAQSLKEAYSKLTA